MTGYIRSVSDMAGTRRRPRHDLAGKPPDFLDFSAKH